MRQLWLGIWMRNGHQEKLSHDQKLNFQPLPPNPSPQLSREGKGLENGAITDDAYEEASIKNPNSIGFRELSG